MSADPRIGTELLDYRIEALLGRGGMSVVYRAQDLRLKRRVALKLLAPELSEDERFRERFVRESELAASLDHPHIVPIYAAGVFQGQLYIAMRYVEGSDLKQLLREEGPLVPNRAIALLAQLADALDAAHARGLVHRDIKPSNALLDATGHVYLADFGLSKRASERSGLTVSGQMLGTINYAAPEQIEGRALDRRADVYSLGCLLYECLTGEVPFPRDSELASLFAHLHDLPPKPSACNSALPTAIDSVVARALAKDPEERYGSCGGLVDAAHAAVRGDPAPRELPRGTVTFLFSDIEGSTQLVRLLGPRYAQVLSEHQRILRAAFAVHGGREVDTQGDSFFVAFGRAKDAVAAAVDAQRDLAAHAWPEGASVKVRMGLHTGEPQVGEDRYVGLGVHKASRIGSAGHGGQVLLSRTTRELVEDELPPGVSVRDLGERRLKDLERPERLAQLVIEGLADRFAPLRTLDVELARRRRRMYAGSALIGVIAAAVAIPVFAFGGGGGGSAVPGVAPNSVAVIDAQSNRVVGGAPVGVRPSSVTAGAGSIWVANTDDRTISRLDPVTRALQRTISLDATPTGIAAGKDAIWVVNGLLGSVSRIDPELNQVTASIDVAPRSSSGAVAVGGGSVWAVFGNSVLGRIDSVRGRLAKTGVAGGSPSGIAVGEGAVWTANSSENTVSRILPVTGTPVATITVGRQPTGIAVGEGAVWVTDRADDLVTRIDPSSGSAVTIPVGDAPAGVAVGASAVWVANAGDGTVSRIDPGRRAVTAVITVGGRPAGVTVLNGRVWVSVQAPE